MPSLVLGYVPASGYVPVISGDIWSGRMTPVGGIQFRADKNNSGNIYISLSGAFVYSGQVGTPPASGGPTITSGGMPLSGGANSGWGLLDGFPLGGGDAYFVPKIGIATTGSNSGFFTLCAGCDPACSGTARLYFEAF